MTADLDRPSLRTTVALSLLFAGEVAWTIHLNGWRFALEALGITVLILAPVLVDVARSRRGRDER